MYPWSYWSRYSKTWKTQPIRTRTEIWLENPIFYLVQDDCAYYMCIIVYIYICTCCLAEFPHITNLKIVFFIWPDDFRNPNHHSTDDEWSHLSFIQIYNMLYAVVHTIIYIHVTCLPILLSIDANINFDEVPAIMFA